MITSATHIYIYNYASVYPRAKVTIGPWMPSSHCIPRRLYAGVTYHTIRAPDAAHVALLTLLGVGIGSHYEQTVGDRGAHGYR